MCQARVRTRAVRSGRALGRHARVSCKPTLATLTILYEGFGLLLSRQSSPLPLMVGYLGHSPRQGVASGMQGPAQARNRSSCQERFPPAQNRRFANIADYLEHPLRLGQGLETKDFAPSISGAGVIFGI